MVVNNIIVNNDSLIGIVDKDGILKSTVEINCPERVMQLDTIVYGKESYNVVGFFQDAEKITAIVESGTGQTYTFRIKLKSEIFDTVRYTLTNRDLLDVDFIPACFAILGNRIGYKKRQEIKLLLESPKSDADNIQEFLDWKFKTVYDYAIENGLQTPNKKIWIQQFRRNNSDEVILKLLEVKE